MRDSHAAAMPFVSVVIPTVNRRESLAVTLGTLPNQRHVAGGFEVIVVSDVSTDGTDGFLLGALHRPTRTFASWLRVPYAYGKLEVLRVQRGDASWNRVRDLFLSRQRATRILAYSVLPSARRDAFVRGTLRRVAEALFAVPLAEAQRVGLSMLSALYNVH
ncbi:MAG: glycosyltransferase [Gemmatimonadaceae bacterium]|nr:glycosyltransferase [Gemmatimonadaceae bacterium]